MITYNHEQYIAQALDSVLMQETDFPFEIVVADDASSDGTTAIVSEYARRHPTVVRPILRGQNIGAARNFITTLHACRGEYIALLDGDDLWHRRDKLALQVAVLDERMDCSLVCSDYDQFDMASGRRHRRTNGRRGLDPSQLGDLRYVVRGTPTSGIHPCTVLARCDLIQKAIANDPELMEMKQYPAGDTPLFAGLASLGRLAYLPESLATYRLIHESSTRGASQSRILQVSIRMKEQAIRICKHYGLPESESELHRRDISLRRLKLAFIEQDSQAASAARDELGSLTPLQWLQFKGAGGRLAHRILLPVLRRLDRRLIPTTRTP